MSMCHKAKVFFLCAEGDCDLVAATPASSAPGFKDYNVVTGRDAEKANE